MTKAETLPEISQHRIAKDIGGERVRYEDIEVGKELGTAPILVTQAQVDGYSARSDEYHPWYSVNSPFGGTIVPVNMSHGAGRRLLSSTYNVVGLHYKWSWEFLHPLLVGVEYTFSAHISEKWIKHEREFVAYEGVCKDAQGNVMFTLRRAHVLDYIKRTAPKIAEGGVESRPTVFDQGTKLLLGSQPESNAPSAVTDHVIDVKPLATRDTPLGAPLPTIAHVYSEEFLDRRSAVEKGGWRPHNWQAARQEGLAKAFAGGGSLSEVMQSAMQFFQRGWVAGGRGDLTMARPTFSGDFNTVRGFVKGKELLADGSARLVCEVWAEGQTGEKRVVGTVSGIVR